MADERRYSEREVRAILERAAQHEHSDGLSHEDLLATAREAGLSVEAVEQAALEIEGLRAQDEARERILARRKAGFYSHLWAFIGVQVFLLALNLLTSPEYLWFLFPLLGWGLGLFFSARHGFSKQVSDHAISREIARSAHKAPFANRRAPAIAQPSAKVRARAPAPTRTQTPAPAPARLDETALEHEFENDLEREVEAAAERHAERAEREALERIEATLPSAGRQRK